MKVVLVTDMESLGKKGEIVEVKSGYARNYLIPGNMALPATKPNLKVATERMKQSVIIDEKEKKASEELAGLLAKVSITVSVQAGEDDKLFGSVTSREIARLLEEQGFSIDRRKILLDNPIKSLGVFNVPISLHAAVEASVKVWVVKESVEEAETEQE
ncbi:50S ribosomal protein L9 [candidate division KSB1 bacterium]